MIKNNSFEGNLTDAAKVANNVESANASSAKSQRGRSSKTTFWSLISKARKNYNVQFDKTNEVKLRSIKQLIPSLTADEEKFWSEYMTEANTLLNSRNNSRKYLAECEKLGVDATTLATHIVFLGSGERSKVLKYGVENVIGTDYRLYVEQFVPDVALQFGMDYKPEKPKDSDNDSTNTAA